MKTLFMFLFLGLLLSCQSGPSIQRAAGEGLGTTYHISYFSEENFPVEEGLDSLFGAINQSMSTYREDSDISRINRGDSTILVDHMFREVFSMSQKVHKESRGYFDPTVGDLVNMYGFGSEKGVQEIDSRSVDSLMQYVGLEKVRISEDGSVLKESPQVYLEFNAIAKGYTVDVIGRYLEDQGVANYLVELGGEILAKGKNLEKDSNWIVGIDDPLQQKGTRRIAVALELKNRAMATSGNYRKFRIDPESGEKYVHTINPRTGNPEKSDLLSATVLAENCALADAYATAFMALGVERSKEVLQELDSVDVYFIFSETEGELGEFFSPGFQEVLVE